MEAAGVLSITFGLGFVLSSTLSLLPYTSLRSTKCPLRVTFVLLLLSLAIWSILQFSTLLILLRLPCSILSILVALADQLSRTLLLALVMFAVRPPIETRSEYAVLYFFIIMRGIIGATVVGLTRSIFVPVCFPSADTVSYGRAPGITQLFFDGTIMAVSVVRALGVYRGGKRGREEIGLIVVVVTGMAWSIAASPYQLRAGSIFVRLSPSLITLSILLALLRAFPMSFFLLDRPEIQDGNHGPSDYPRVDSNGRMQRLGSTTSIIAQHSSQQYRSADVESARTNSSVFRGILGAPIVHPGTMASWASEASSAPRPPLSQNQLVETRLPSHAGGRPNISGPMLSGGILHAQGSGRGRDMRTVSLQMAAGQERARVDAVFEREEESRRQELGGGSEVFETPRTIASFAGLPTSIVDSRYSQSTLPRNPVLPRVSAVANLRGEYQDIVAPQNEIPQDEVPQNGVQRGYRNTYSTEDDDMTRYTYSQTGFTLTPAPRSMPQRSMVEDGGQRVLFMNGIEYDDPALVHSLVSGQDEIARSTGRYTPRSIGVLRRSPSAPAGPPPQREIPELPNSCSGIGSGRLTPILSRKRPTKMRDSSRALFPLGQPEFPSPPRGKGARTAITTVTAPPPQPDQPLPTSPLEKVRKSVPPPILVLPPRHSSLGPPRSAVENAITPATPAPPTPYETAKAWIASVAPVAKNEGPVLVDIPNRRSGPENMAVSPIDSPDAPRDSVAIDNVEIPTEPTTVSETRRLSLVPMNSPHHPSISSVLAENPEEIVVDFHKGMSFLNSPPVEENEGEEESAPSLTTAASSHSSPRARRRRSFPSPTAFSVDLEHDNNFPISPVYTDASESQSPSSAGFSESVIISDLEDAMELEEMHLRHQRLVPHRFKLGDKIPTFYGRRKQLPAPLGTVPPKGRPISQVHQKRISSIMEPPLSSAVRIQTRLTMLTSKQQALAAVPSDPSRDSLIQQLEFEVSQQETQWMGMRQTLCLEDPLSPFDSLDSKQLSQRRTSVAKLQIGLERRLSIALTSATTDTTATGSVGGWQKQLADAQIEYLQQVPQLSKSVEMLRLVESESESELGSEIDDEFEMEIIEPLPSTVYVNPTIVLSPVLASPKSEGETDMYDEIMPLDVCPRPKAGLWRAPLVVLPEINAGTCLWDNAQLYTTSCRSCALPPAAIAVRPQKRFDVAPMQLETRRTWQKPRAPVVREQTGLWRDPNFRPKSIISNHRRGSSAKRRVAFVEEVVTVEATGLLGKLGKLKKLWGGKPATTTVTVKRHVQVGVPPAATMNHEKPVAKILDGITKKYQAKALPKLPVMVSRPKEYLWSDPKRRSLRKRTTKLWPAAEDVKVAVFDTPTRGNRARVRDDSMPAFKSTSLWTPATDGRLHGFSMQTKGKGLWSHAAIPTRAGILAVVGVEPQQTVHVHPIANSAVVRRSKRLVIANTHQQQQQQNVRGQQQQQQRFVVQVGGRVFSSAALAVPPVPPARSSSPHASPAVVPQAIATKPSLPQPHTRSPDYSAPIALPPPVVADESKHSRRYLWPSTVANTDTDTDTDTATTTTTTSPSSTNNSMDQQQAALWTLTSSNKAFVVTASTPAALSSRPKPAPISAEPLRADGSLWTLSGDGSQPKKPQLWQPLSVSLKGLWRDATSFAGHAEERNHGQKLLWSQKEAKRTTDAIPDRIRKAVTPDIKPVTKVGGGLWNAQTRHVDGDNADVVPKVDEQLWTASASPRLEPSTVPTSPLSTRETRQHMTTSATSTPERFISTLSTMTIDLPKATGNLWENRSVSVKKGKVIVSGSLLGLPEPEQAWRPTLRKSKSSLTVRPVEAVPEVEKIEVKVAGRLWNAPAPKPDLPAVPTFPLWTKETAQRTTAAKPERVVPAPRKMSIDLPKATGSLWDHRNVAVKKGKVVVSNSLWNLAEPVHAPALRHSKSRRTLVAVPKTDAEKEKVVEVKVGGRLWTAPIPKVITPLPKETPLWTPATASRTTTAAPERGVKAVQKMSVDLPKATGSLWNMPQLPQDIVVKKGRVVVSGGLWNHQEKPAQRPALRKSKSSLTVLAMEKKEVDEEEVEKIEVKVAGRLWIATTSQSPPSRVVAADAPLWTKETALRTTTAMPERSIVVPRKMSLDLPKVTGPLWDNRYVVIKKGKIVVSTNCRTESSLQPPVLKRTKSSRTLIMERKDEEAEEVEKIEIKVVGRLLVAELPELPAPKEEIPVWIPAKEAPRTTDAIPVRLTAPTPKKVSSELPRATGSLWTGRDVVVKKGKVVVSTNLMNHAEALQPPPLQRSKSSITVIPVEKYETVKEVEIKVAGRLWTARAPSPPPPPATTLEAPLWTKDAAKRTTTAMPERVVTAPRKISVNLPKATGPLWDSRDVVVKKGKVVVGSSNLWSLQPPVQQAPTLRKSKSRVTLIVVEKTEAPETGKVEVKVAGRLWSATIPSTPTLPSTPMSPLWNKETAERTTTATPSGIAVSAPKKVATDVPLPKATGPLWGPDRQIVVKKSKVVISKDLWGHQQPAESPVLRKSKSSRTLIAVLNDDEEHRNELSVKVGGRLLTARTPSPPPAPLWIPSTPAVVAEPEPSYTWSKHTAARTTSQPPVRGVVLKKARNNHSGTMATDSLWGNQQSPPVLRKSRSPRTLIAIPDDNSEPKHTEQQQQFSLKIGRRVVTALPVEPSTLWTPSGAPPTEAIPGLSRTSTISSSDSSDVREGDNEVEMVVRRMKSGHGTLWTPNGGNDDVVVGKVTGSQTKKRVVVGGR